MSQPSDSDQRFFAKLDETLQNHFHRLEKRMDALEKDIQQLPDKIIQELKARTSYATLANEMAGLGLGLSPSVASSMMDIDRRSQQRSSSTDDKSLKQLSNECSSLTPNLHNKHTQRSAATMASIMQRRMLSKEDETPDEVEVRREDQDKINRFSRLHQRELALEEELKGKSKEKEELEDLTTELELADEDEKIQYKIGDAFFHLALEQAQEMLEQATTQIEDDTTALEDKLGTIREEMQQLKVELSHTDHTVIGWEVDDPENPYNWSISKKTKILLVTVFLIINATMGSSLPSMAVPYIAREYGVESQEQKVLPISVYLIGLVLGPLTWGPLSEHLGRRNISLATHAGLTIFTMACALAPNWPAFLVFRFLAGYPGSCSIVVSAGILADIYGDPTTRGRAFSVISGTTIFGPLLAPVVSGYASTAIGWRWTFWIGLIFAGSTLVFSVFFLPETYGPILLARRAKRMRKNDPSLRVVAPRELEEMDLSKLVTVVLTRPIRMLFSELIVSSSCAYLALVYAIFYMSFQAFPIIFQRLYGLSPGETGLAYLPIGGGALLVMPMFWYWERVLKAAQVAKAPWVNREEYRRLPLACVGGPLFAISLFWLGFSARKSVSFVVPMLAGIPFGFGYQLIFWALLNYLTDAYEIFAASANATASTFRSLFAVILPLATTHMFNSLGISGACSLLGGLSALMCLIPFIFIWKGPMLRSRSRFCIALQEQKEELQRKADEERRVRERSSEKC
ncbi:MFS-type efflux pump MFS2 [Paramyrothecium foliicola]|nr:MFS-type efflux pump MFS2 [Paramyrothecium foliicola]